MAATETEPLEATIIRWMERVDGRLEAIETNVRRLADAMQAQGLRLQLIERRTHTPCAMQDPCDGP